MAPGQRVRVRPASAIAKRNELPLEALGTVLCSYNVRSKTTARERLDVKFSSQTIMWGVAADEFELIEDSAAPTA